MSMRGEMRIEDGSHFSLTVSESVMPSLYGDRNGSRDDETAVMLALDVVNERYCSGTLRWGLGE